MLTLLADSTVAGKDLKSVMTAVAYLVVILVGALGFTMPVEPTVELLDGNSRIWSYGTREGWIVG